MTPRFFGLEGERRELPFTEMSETVGAADWEWGLGGSRGNQFSSGFKGSKQRCEISSWICDDDVLETDLADI